MAKTTISLSCQRCSTLFTSYNHKRRYCSRSCASKSHDKRYLRKHGHAASKAHRRPASAEYVAYMHAKRRCTNPRDPAYSRYGGRGIGFRFKSFESFLNELGPKPSSEYSLDRYPDNDGHYEPGNVRWATRSQQQLNTRVNRRIELNGVTLTDTEWSRSLGLAPNAVRERLRMGWCEPCAVTPRLGRGYGCPHRGGRRVYTAITFKGETLMACEWEARFGWGRNTIHYHKKFGRTIEDIIALKATR
jgi:hypothetical protein